MSIVRDIWNAFTTLLMGRPQRTYDEVIAALEKKAKETPQKLNWRTSIVDLLKLIGVDSSLQARAMLASELGYTDAFHGTAEQNIWLHKKVMEKLGRELK